MRIGINLGDVIEGEDRHGEGVYIAARLQELAEPGGVTVSGTAYDHLHGKIGLTVSFAGEQRVKNIARPVRVYQLRLDRPEAAEQRPLFCRTSPPSPSCRSST
jgi:adenylate cyclase